jgi:hypothetical protein
MTTEMGATNDRQLAIGPFSRLAPTFEAHALRGRISSDHGSLSSALPRC